MKTTLTCPYCAQKQEGEIPSGACVPFYKCNACRKTVQAKPEDCCVFCSYADARCPLKK